MTSFQSFIMDPPGSGILHTPNSPEDARCMVMFAPGDLRILGLLLERIASTPDVFDDDERASATILNFWMEKAYFSFSEEERAVSEANRG